MPIKVWHQLRMTVVASQVSLPKDMQRAGPNDTASSSFPSILTGCSVGSQREGTLEKDMVVFGKGCGGGGEKEEEQWKTDRKRGPEESSKHGMSVYQ